MTAFRNGSVWLLLVLFARPGGLLAECAPQPAPLTGAPPRFLNEVRVAVVAHDATPFENNRAESGTADFNGEVRFASHRLLRFLCYPRPHAGGTVNFSGLTNQLYGGFTWTLDNGSRLFLDIDLGFAVHDGKLRDATGERLPLGSRLLFRAAAEPGLRFGPSLRYSVTAFWDHVSNASILGHPNRGLDTLGARFGYWFH